MMQVVANIAGVGEGRPLGFSEREREEQIYATDLDCTPKLRHAKFR